jgi:hypothetical protein
MQINNKDYITVTFLAGQLHHVLALVDQYLGQRGMIVLGASHEVEEKLDPVFPPKSIPRHPAPGFAFLLY